MYPVKYEHLKWPISKQNTQWVVISLKRNSLWAVVGGYYSFANHLHSLKVSRCFCAQCLLCWR